ncbi:MAG: hypothetical protein PHU88_08785 [candidate division Zixibacteria bacterium]|nr:hypothetical protein [candidate division Zixibacteria bacterium]MDD5427197.1 hypothetical protein [candidate division Zixibacteria bacterium]
MEINLIYSKDDPRQTKARNFVKQFLHDRGVLAKVFESDQPVKSPTLIVNGQILTDSRQKPRGTDTRMYPGIDDIAEVLEKHIWSF